MKKLLVLLVLMCTAMFGFAQSETPIQFASQSVTEPKEGANYKLFPTRNNWTFLKLDTRSGMLWEIQFSIKKEYGYRYEKIISLQMFATGDDAIPGRFTIYQTNNYYNYILLDQIDGRCWQVQWDKQDSKNNFVERIY